MVMALVSIVHSITSLQKGRPYISRRITGHLSEFDGVTVIGGSEATLPDGRLTFFGSRDVPDIALATFPPEAMKQAREWGAFPVVA